MKPVIARSRVSTSPAVVRCPFCKAGSDELVHLAGVDVLQGHSTAVVRHESVTVIDAEAGGGLSGGHRGSRVKVLFFCEGGHSFSFEFQFHKGETRVEVFKGPDPEGPAAWGSLWRD
jgi:hypothetical protein